MILVETPTRQYSRQEYLAQEETAEYRSEYHNGEIVPMAGGSLNHNRIIRNLSRLLELGLQGQLLEVFISDLRLFIPHYNEYTYPDILIIKDEPKFEEGRTDTVINPSIIFEVLSKSTSSRDRGDKFTFYRSLPEFQEYILIDQYQIHIEQFSKTQEGKWLLSESDDENGILTLASTNFQIPYRQIYERVTFTKPTN